MKTSVLRYFLVWPEIWQEIKLSTVQTVTAEQCVLLGTANAI
jgi:hypothetical protein